MEKVIEDMARGIVADRFNNEFIIEPMPDVIVYSFAKAALATLPELIVLDADAEPEVGDAIVVRYNFEKRGMLVWYSYDDTDGYLFTDQYGEASDYEIEDCFYTIIQRKGVPVLIRKK